MKNTMNLPQLEQKTFGTGIRSYSGKKSFLQR